MTTLKDIFYYVIVLFSINTVMYGQLNFTEDFEFGLTWNDVEGGYYEAPEEFGSCNGISIVGPLTYIFETYPIPIISPSLGISNGGVATLQYDYKITWMDLTVGLPNDPEWGSVVIEYALSVDGPWILIETIMPENHEVSDNCFTRSATFTPEEGGEIFIKYTCIGNPDQEAMVDGSFVLDNVIVTQADPCLTPAPEELPDTQIFCNAATVADFNTADFFEIRWYTDISGGEPLPLSTQLSQGVYYASQVPEGENVCESVERTAVEVIISTTEIPIIESPQVFEDSVQLYSIVNGEEGTVIWYATEAGALAGANPLPENTEITENGTYYATQTINDCASAPVAVEFQILLSSRDFNKNSFKYHPNPVQNVLHLSYDKNITGVIICNLLGQEVYSEFNANKDVIVDLSSHQTGTYILKVMSDDSFTMMKIIKVN